MAMSNVNFTEAIQSCKMHGADPATNFLIDTILYSLR